MTTLPGRESDAFMVRMLNKDFDFFADIHSVRYKVSCMQLPGKWEAVSVNSEFFRIFYDTMDIGCAFFYFTCHEIFTWHIKGWFYAELMGG